MKDYTIYVTEKIAKKAIEKGFEGHSVCITEPLPNIFESKDHYHYFIPTAEQICGWLRNEKKVQVDVSYRSRYEDKTGKVDFSDWYYVIRGINLYQIIEDTEISSYEGALLEGINEALDLI